MSNPQRGISVECRNIELSFGKTKVLRDLNLSIVPGEFFALLGPSGSGKSTLLRLIAGFNRHQAGELLVDGRDITTVPAHLRNVGMVFQNYALWPHLSVFDNVAFGLVERRAGREEIRRRVGAALATVGLGDLAARRPGQLSGGQQQRVALARTIVIEPRVLLLDEPLSNLDKNLRVQMREDLLSLQRKLGLTTIFVTHDQEEAMTTADRMAVLDQGIVQQVGSPIELFDEPVNRFVAHFVGTTNTIEGEIVSRDASTIRFASADVGELVVPATAAAPNSGKACVTLRPHTVHLARARPAGGEGCVWVDGEVEHSEFLGEFARYRVRVGSLALLADEAHRLGAPLYRPGERVAVGITPQETRCLA